jgi:hypothetical protein
MRSFNSDYLIPDLKNTGSQKLNVFENKGGNIFHGQILSYTFCDFIMKKVRKYELDKKNKRTKPVNSMHANAILIDELDISDHIKILVNLILLKTIYSLFPRCTGIPFDSLHSYIVRYSDNLDTDLGFHVDDSLVTINLCLNDKFVGSDLIFKGIRCPIHVDTPSTNSEGISIKHKKGFMVLHDGKNRHYVNSIQEGERYNLIIWCQNNNENIEWHKAQENHECMDYCDYLTILE